MEDSNWLDAMRFYALPLDERRKLLFAQREYLLERQKRLELQRQELKAKMARLALQQQMFALRPATLEEHQEEVVAPRRDTVNRDAHEHEILRSRSE